MSEVAKAEPTAFFLLISKVISTVESYDYHSAWCDTWWSKLKCKPGTVTHLSPEHSGGRGGRTKCWGSDGVLKAIIYATIIKFFPTNTIKVLVDYILLINRKVLVGDKGLVWCPSFVLFFRTISLCIPHWLASNSCLSLPSTQVIRVKKADTYYQRPWHRNTHLQPQSHG